MFIALFAWLRGRRRFIFLDSVVRNRNVIGEPWKEFRAEGNSFFLFSLFMMLVLIAVTVIAGLVLIVPFIPRGDQAQPGLAFWIGLSLFVFVAVCLAFVWALVSQLMVTIMYLQRCRARLAFAQAVDLVSSHPGPILLYVLFLLVLGVAAVIICFAGTTATSLIAAISSVWTRIFFALLVMLRSVFLLILLDCGG